MFYHSDVSPNPTRNVYFVWNNIVDSEGLVLLQSLVHVKTTKGDSVAFTIHHTTSRIQIQGNEKTKWATEGEYDHLLKVYQTSGNNPSDIEAKCKEVFEERNVGNDFVTWTSESTLPENDQPPDVPPQPVIECLLEMVDAVVINCDPDQIQATNAVPTPSVEHTELPKVVPRPKYTPDVGWVENMTAAVNKMDDRISSLSDDVRGLIVSLVSLLTQPVVDECHRLRGVVNEIQSAQEEIIKDHQNIGTISRINGFKVEIQGLKDSADLFRTEVDTKFDNLSESVKTNAERCIDAHKQSAMTSSTRRSPRKLPSIPIVREESSDVRSSETDQTVPLITESPELPPTEFAIGMSDTQFNTTIIEAEPIRLQTVNE